MTDPLVTLLKPQEAASRLRVTRIRMAIWRRKKTGPPYFRFGRRIRYDPNDIEQWRKAWYDD